MDHMNDEELELSPQCAAFREAMEIVGSRWTGEILRALVSGAERFSEISEGVPGMSDRLLSERLKLLEAEDIVTRKVEPGPPVRVCYTLTRKGRGLVSAMDPLARWADKWIGAGAR